MSWLSKKVGGWWDKASGQNQKFDPNQLGTDYDTSMTEVNKGYDKISEYAEGMMDPYSQQNMAQRSMMEQQGADAAAQSSRLAGRNAAMAGGAPAGVLAAQTASTANQSLAGSNNAFNQYLQGAQGQGASMLSGVLANQGQMQNQKFQMMQSQRQANAQADTQGAQFGANLLGQAIGMIPGLQEGGMAYDNMDHHIAYDGYQNGGVVGEDGKQHYFLGGLAASIGMGALKKGYDSLEGDSATEKFGNIKGNLGKLGEGIQEGVSKMKQQAADTDYHRDEGAARAAAGTEYAASDEGQQAIEDARALGESNKEWNAANVGKKFGDEGFLSRENVGTIRVNDMMDKYAKAYDVEGGKHRVGATRAALEDFRNSDTTKAVGKGIAGTYGLAKEGVGVAKDAVVGGTGLLAGAIGEGAVTAGKAIKKDWQKESGSIGKGLLRGASTLLKEVGSPGYMQGKEMANIKFTKDKTGIDNDDDETTKTTTKTPQGLLDPTQESTSQRVAQPNEDNRVEIDGEKIVPDAILSKVKSSADLASLDAESIKGIQESLKAAGYDMSSSEVDGGMDGKAGPDTMKMMQEYIDKQGKQQGGYIGMQEGGTVWNPAKPPTNHSGMLSRVMGPNGEMGIKTRMGGFKIG